MRSSVCLKTHAAIYGLEHWAALSARSIGGRGVQTGSLFTLLRTTFPPAGQQPSRTTTREMFGLVFTAAAWRATQTDISSSLQKETACREVLCATFSLTARGDFGSRRVTAV